MRWTVILPFFLFIFSITAHAENGGYIVEPLDPQNIELADTSGANATISFWELPLWIKIAYVSFLILAGLGLFKIIPVVLGRFKDKVENRVREGILEYVVDNPGSTIAEISKQKEINRGSVKYHIHKLEFEKRIILRKMGKFLRVFRNSGTFKEKEQLMITHLKDEMNRLILWNILRNPGITNLELTEKFHLDKSTVHWHIQQFCENNIVVYEQDGKYRRYFIKADAQMTLQKVMAEIGSSVDHAQLQDKFMKQNQTSQTIQPARVRRAAELIDLF